MFEDVCLLCGKHLLDDGRAYCSDECQNLDSVSPSISSASSAVSSPYLSGHPLCGDIPALVPSALGSAFGDYTTRDHYSASSSASSTAWSIVTDDDDIDNPALRLESEYSFHDGDPGFGEGPSKSANYLATFMRAPALSYARRPSGTNNHSTVPILHRRTSSLSTTEHVQGAPCSAPIHCPSSCSSADEEDYSSDHKHTTDHTEQFTAGRASRKYKDYDRSTLTNSKPKRTRNRASLPAYFSLLQVNGSSSDARSSLSSSAHTVARPSPPTPKLPLANLATATVPHLSPEGPSTAHIYTTPRGRRREPGTSRSSRRSDASFSRSRSRSRSHNIPEPSKRPPRSRVDSKGSVEQVFDWSSMLVPRGRTSVRRNSSPPPKMILPAFPDGQGRSSAPFATTTRTRSGRSDSRRSRGRARPDELDGFGTSKGAPGYGYGRSGLLDREHTGYRAVGEYR